jgi:hypothetical protein
VTRLPVEYVLPLRWTSDEGLVELARYLDDLAAIVDVTVVDGSPPERFAAHAATWGARIRHLPVTARPGRNGKVSGVLTGVDAARHEAIVIADDDVRYDRASLAAVVAALAGADLVAPQNVFRPAPWHARWDTGRSLLNRALGADYPGTHAVRRSSLQRIGGYDADVLFENLELQRSIRAAGGTVRRLRGVYVARRPPTLRRFLEQRVRQAYDSLAQPVRMLAEAAVVPALLLSRGRPRALAFGAALLVGVAAVGRLRAGGRRVYPVTAPLWAPAWTLERGVAIWCALVLRVLGGVRYAGGRLHRAATPARVLRRRLAGRLDGSGRAPVS